MFSLRADILRNLGNMTDIGRKLHEPLWGVPRAVRDYIDETRAQLRAIAQDNDVPIQEKLAFLQETRHCFGRTALLLSGGGTLGTFHVGVARALHSRGLLPRVLAGSSVGSIVAAIIASRTPEELDEFFSEKHFWDLLPDMTFFSGRDFFSSIQHLMRTGALHDIDFFQRCLRALLGDLTFQEAYDRSGGRILCVCVCATRAWEKPRLLNYLTSPHLSWGRRGCLVRVSLAVPAAAALGQSRNGAFVPWQPEGKLGARRWRDGSLENDLPMQGLSELFNVNYFIVSQTNPHIVPILRLKRWFASKNRIFAMIAQFLESEWRHRCTQVLDLVPWVDTFDFAKLFGQQWEGNVTVVMEYSWKQFKNIATNPTREFLFETATMGEREMWPKLATIESNCGIEMQLDECVRALREKLSQRQGYMNLKQPGRVPRGTPSTTAAATLPPHAPDRRQHRVDHHRERQRKRRRSLASSVERQELLRRGSRREHRRTLRTLDPRRLRREHVGVDVPREQRRFPLGLHARRGGPDGGAGQGGHKQGERQPAEERGARGGGYHRQGDHRRGGEPAAGDVRRDGRQADQARRERVAR